MPSSHDSAASFVAVEDETFRADPIPALARAQERNWYASTENGIWVLRQEDAFTVARSPHLHSLGTDLAERFGIGPGPFLDWFAGAIASLEGPPHKRVRDALMPLFSARALERTRDAMRGIVDELVDSLPDTGEFNFVSAVADPLSLGTLCALLGLPTRELDRLRDWQDALMLAFNHGYAHLHDHVDAAVIGMAEYVEEILREQGSEGPLGQLVSAAAPGRGLTRQEVHSALVTLLFAVDNVRVQIARTVLLLLQNPQVWQLLTQRPELATNAVEETMRLSPSQPMFARKVVHAFEHRGLLLREDWVVSLVIMITNRDPRVYPRPHELDITRPRSAHLSLGHGVHYCLGAALSRLELTEILVALARRRPGLRLVHDPGLVRPDLPVDSVLCTLAEEPVGPPGDGRGVLATASSRT
jgi:cytochrome P450